MRRPLAVLGALSIAISGWAAVLLGTAAPASAAWSPPVFERSIGGSGLAGLYASDRISRSHALPSVGNASVTKPRSGVAVQLSR